MTLKLTDEQQLAIAKKQGRICVSAGAGSGKTRVLVERIASLLEERRATPRQLLAVTFTNKAAGEMKERLRGKVEEKIQQVDSLTERKFWEAMLDELPLAVIGTIHGFCGKVLRSHPVESGFDPTFRVADEAQATLLVKQAITSVMEKALRDKETAVMQLCAAFGLSSVYRRVTALWKERQRLPVQMMEWGEWSYINEPHLTTLIGECWERIKESATTPAQKGNLQKATTGTPAIEVLMCELWTREEAASAILARLKAFSATGKVKVPLQEMRAALAEVLGAWAEKKAGPLNQLFYDLLARVSEQVVKRQRIENILFFDDLEQEAIRLLKEHPEVRRQWQKRFAYIMVDEFQDTNQTQLNLLNLLDDGKNGNFFFVGDDKQSIYRFRGAQVEVFWRLQAELPDENCLQLAKNFRSEPAVLAAVNTFFAGLYGAFQQPALKRTNFIPLEAGRPVKEGVQAGNLFLIETEGDGKTAEADLIAFQIARLIEAETVDVGGRSAGYGDCALLFRSGMRMNMFAERLRAANIPCQIIGGSGFYDRQEVQDILMLLSVLDNRFRELELVGVLRSPFFGLTDETLLMLTGTASLWESLLAAEQQAWLQGPQRTIVLRASRVLPMLRTAARWLSPQQLGEMILKETEAAVGLAAGVQSAEALANIDKLFAQMVQYCQETGGGIGQFLTYVEECRSVEAREEMAQTDSGDVVQLMTIHKAKGLEFPIVFLPELDARFPAQAPDVLFSDDGMIGCSIKIDGEWIPTLTQQRLGKMHREAERAEAARVLYVAMTRAKEKLVLTAQRPKNMDVGYVDQLREKGPEEAGSWLEWILAFWPCPVEVVTPADISMSKSLMQQAEEAVTVKDWQAVFPLAAPLSVVRPKEIFLSATALSIYRLCPRWFYYRYRLDMPECRGEEAGSGGGAEALALGLLTHKMLELAMQGDKNYAEVALRLLPEAKGQENLALALAMQFLESALGRQLQNGTTRVEVPFNFALPLFADCLAQFSGIIDCLLIHDDKSCSIVDYKTNLLNATNIKETASKYEHQLMIYSLAMEKTYDSVRDASLCFLRSGLAVSLDLQNDRERLIGEIVQTGRVIVDSRAEKDFPVNLSSCALCMFNGFCRRV